LRRPSTSECCAVPWGRSMAAALPGPGRAARLPSRLQGRRGGGSCCRLCPGWCMHPHWWPVALQSSSSVPDPAAMDDKAEVIVVDDGVSVARHVRVQGHEWCTRAGLVLSGRAHQNSACNAAQVSRTHTLSILFVAACIVHVASARRVKVIYKPQDNFVALHRGCPSGWIVCD
jgi:hypothetical protein